MTASLDSHDRFRDRNALVTGAGSGIGREIALALTRNGASVAFCDINEESATDACTQIAAPGATACSVVLDVANPVQVDAAFEQAERTLGPMHIVIHSAGIGQERGFLETSAEEWQRLLDVDLTGTFHVGQAAAKRMVSRGYGRIVNLASTAGVRGGTGRAAYGAAKAGVIQLTRVMAVELAQHGITVNALAPGAIETELVARMHSQTTRLVYRRAIPMDRYGTPGEVAGAALFLASDDAAYVTGHILAVDGGFLAAGVLHKSY